MDPQADITKKEPANNMNVNVNMNGGQLLAGAGIVLPKPVPGDLSGLMGL